MADATEPSSSAGSDAAAGAAVVLLCTDLMFESRITGAGRAAGLDVQAVAAAAAAIRIASRPGCRMLILDLSTPGLQVAELLLQLEAECDASGRPQVVAFGPPVQTARLTAAREAGCDRVLTRGAFDAGLRDLFAAVAG